ncbi:hypothetical protein GA0070563_12172 [Micromonospora carbonacea]|uniref:Uncharacterized protein n=1 Tax=Micromonospora carbonacea TaxID=47853 RepID=A0A1C5AVS8_9ACTN|nr:hypothetical protein GA0070563_12172 [Micromonospora carbonacea]
MLLAPCLWPPRAELAGDAGRRSADCRSPAPRYCPLRQSTPPASHQRPASQADRPGACWAHLRSPSRLAATAAEHVRLLTVALDDLLSLSIGDRVLHYMTCRTCPPSLSNLLHQSLQLLGCLWVIAQQVLQTRRPRRLLLQTHTLILQRGFHYETRALQPSLDRSDPPLVASPEQLSKPTLGQLPAVCSHRANQRCAASTCQRNQCLRQHRSLQINRSATRAVRHIRPTLPTEPSTIHGWSKTRQILTGLLYFQMHDHPPGEQQHAPPSRCCRRPVLLGCGPPARPAMSGDLDGPHGRWRVGWWSARLARGRWQAG